MHVQKRVLPLHPHLLISVIAFRSTLAALLASASPLSFAFGSFIGLRPLLMLGLHATVLAGRSTRRGGVVGRYSVSVLLKQIIAGIEMIIEIEERIELLQGSINRKH